MKKHFYVLFIILFSLLSSFSQGAELYSNIALNKNAEFSDYRNFLIRLGFKDYCLEMQKSLNTPDLTDVSKRVLEYNINHYQIINAAREVAAYTFSFSKTQFFSEENQNKLMALSSFLLLPTKNISTEAIEEYATAKKISTEDSFDFLQKNKIAQEKRLIMATINAVTGENDSTTLTQLDSYLSRYLELKYTDDNLKQTNYLGRAMVASLVRFARLNHIDSIESALRLKLQRHKVFLNNYITETLTIIDNKKQAQTLTLHAGDFANEYSKGSEAYYISIGTTPTGFKNRLKASTNHLLGNAFKIAIYPTPDTEKVILDKVAQKKPLSAMEKIQYSLIQNKPTIPGYSHAGLVDLKEDAESGIKMSWIWDSYPNDDLGGIRFIGAEGFVFPGEFQKIGFVHYSPKKFLSYYKAQVKSRGYLKDVWLSYGSKIEDNLISIDDSQDKYAWPANITENEVLNFATTEDSQAEAWFKNEIAPRVTGMMEKYFTGTEAIAFADGFNNVRGAAYCSEAVVLAYLQGADIDPEVQKDKLSLIVHIGHALKLSELEDIDLTQRVVSPAGFAWQTDLVETHIPIMIEQDVDEANTNANVAIITNQLN